MVIHVAKQVAASAGRSAVPVADPILASKITAPGVPGLAVERPRISELLARGTRWSRLTVVTGPPGTGKTMALTLWAAAEPRTVAWVALDRYDNRPEAFWSYVVAALRRSGTVIRRRGGPTRTSREPITRSCSGLCQSWLARTHR
jgi:ATP/maltotriose-dependent transcriptional regulator MalT